MKNTVTFSAPSLIELTLKVLITAILTTIEVVVFSAALGGPEGWDVALLTLINWSAVEVTAK